MNFPYIAEAVAVLERIDRTQAERIRQVAERIATSVADGGIVHLFGSGHSHLPVLEVFIRAGTLTCTRAVWPNQSTDVFEQVEGVAAAMLRQYDLRAGEVFIVFSNSGINPLPIEAALGARESGLFTVGVSSHAYGDREPSRHSSGQKLRDVVDLAIDTGVPEGDAMLDSGLGARIGPGSTIANVGIVHSIMTEAVLRLAESGKPCPIRISRNVEGGAQQNRRYNELYGDRIPELRGWIA